MGTLDTKLQQQYDAVHRRMGWFDRSETGKLAIFGKDRLSWLQGMVTNDVRRLNNRAETPLQACVLDATGHVLSDMILVPVVDLLDNDLGPALNRDGEDFVLVDLPRENIQKIALLFDRFLITEDVEIVNITDKIGCVSMQGGEAMSCRRFGFGNSNVEAAFSPLVYSTASNHTGRAGFDSYFPVESKVAVHAALHEAGIVEIGPEVQEILRVEAGFPKYGVDMDATILAPEARLMETHISLTKGCYVGQEIIARIDSRGHTNRTLTGLVVVNGVLPVSGDKLLTLPTDAEPQSRETGRITSVIPISPRMHNAPIALGYVRHEHALPGTQLLVSGKNHRAVVEVVDLPFPHKPS